MAYLWHIFGFAAKAGAARVIGVDVSAIADEAKLIVIDNSLSEVVTIIRARQSLRSVCSTRGS